MARIAYEARRVYARALGEQGLPEWDAGLPAAARGGPGRRRGGALRGGEQRRPSS